MRADQQIKIRAVRDMETRRALEALGGDSADELGALSSRIEAVNARIDLLGGGSGAKEFTKVDPRVVVYNPSGTNGDGSYQAASTVDFSSAVASGAKRVYVYVAIAVDDPGEVAPGWGFTWKPTGWTDTLEKFTRLTVDTAIEDKNTHALPLSDALTVDIAVYKPDNGVGDAWSYSFEVWGYE